jgi:hypothetical protein
MTGNRHSGILSIARTASEPWLMEMIGRPADAYELAWMLGGHGIVARVLRGGKMTRLSSLFDEVGAALQFPDYFGENRPALDECLADLSWLPGDAYVLIVADAVRVLDEEPPERFEMFLDVLLTAAKRWASPVEVGESWDRPSVPFHVAFQVDPAASESLRTRFASAGSDLESDSPPPEGL